MNNEQQSSQSTAGSADDIQSKIDNAPDFDETVRQAEAERKEDLPGSTGGDSGSQHNNGRGGGK